MDLKHFYSKVREQEKGIADEFPVVISLETPDGGRDGIASEVTRTTAATLVVEGKARLATPEEAAKFREQTAEAKRAADQAAAASRMQVTVISDADLRALRGKKG